MKIVLDTHCVLEGLTPDQERYWQGRCNYQNPAFTEARRAGRKVGPTRDHPYGIPEKIGLWESTTEGLVLPRGMFREVRGKHPGAEIIDSRLCPVRGPLDLNAELRDYQEEAIVAAAIENEQGVIQAPTGSGKTVIAMGLMARLATPAIMLVHTKVLLDQSAASVRRFLGIEPGMIGAGQQRIQDITIAMVPTLAHENNTKLLQDIGQRFGLLIQDECHHAAAASFRRIIQSFPARYRFGVTATPIRKDGLTQMLWDVVGPKVYFVAPKRLIDQGAITPAKVERIYTTFCPQALPMQRLTAFQQMNIRKQGRTPRPSLDTGALMEMLTRDPERNQLILDTILQLHEERSLVLTERVPHAHWIAASLAARGLRSMAMTGETSDRDRDAILSGLRDGTLPVMVSTPNLVGEGFDLPIIDTVFLIVPNGNITRTTQALGRVLRPAKGKDRGRIVDFVDSGVPRLRDQAVTRDRVYKTFERSDSELALGRTA